MEKITDVVNENDEIIDRILEKEAHNNKDIITRAVAIFLYNSKGELLLQKRSKNKYRFPLHWTSSASGFVDQNETYIEAAVRELNEELGTNVSQDNLVFLFKKLIFIDIKHITSVYSVVYDGTIKFSDDEVEKVEFFSMSKIKEMISGDEKFTPFFLKLFEKVK